MTSRPLFIIVAESIVILGPIFQVGWASASSTVIAVERVEPAFPEGAARGRQDQPARLPGIPAAQRLVDRAVLGVHREQLGAACAGLRARISSPATTRGSLLASASRRPARTAA